MLGPLEVVGPAGPMLLKGIKRRATLGFLLMQANRVVAISRLLNELWPVDEAPPSARKILQNAIWGLRTALAEADPGGSTELVTQPPGYMLRVDPANVDLYRFQDLVADGQAKITAGQPAVAARMLREALALWRGPAMADLVEVGISWPELTAVQNARLDAMETYFDAELACGRHQAILAELHAMVEAEPLRERSCGQLMLALYRCGRQADALGVYSRVRTALVEDLGLEPGHGLRTLQQQILTHAPALSLPPAASGARPVISARPPAAAPAPPATSAVVPAQRAAEPRPLAAVTPFPGGAEPRDLTALLVRVQLGPALDEADPAEIDEMVEYAADQVRAGVESTGGTVVNSMGLVSLALFGLDRAGADIPERAVRAAVAIRDAATQMSAWRAGDRPLVTVQAAVSSGRALVRGYLEEASPAVTGGLLDRCHDMLGLVPRGEIWVCEATRAASQAVIAYQQAESDRVWRVRDVPRAHAGPGPVPIVDREHELEVVRGMLERTSHRAVPHLVTVFGELGAGKTRFVMEFERRIAGRPGAPRFVAGRVPAREKNDPRAPLREMVRSLCGIGEREPIPRVRARLVSTVRELAETEERARWLVSRLGPLLGVATEVVAPERGGVLDAVRFMLTRVSTGYPLVLVVDDLHHADEALLDLVEGVADARDVPLMVIAAARPSLLLRRPDWGSGKRHATTITLEPHSEFGIDRLLGGAREHGDGLPLRPEIVA